MSNAPDASSDTADNWLYGPYRIYPLPDAPDISTLLQTPNDFDKILDLFPYGVEAYCVIAFLAAADDADAWTGASYAYLDRLAVGTLARMHRRVAWKRLFIWIVTFGKSNKLTRADIIDIALRGFINMFWRSMRLLEAQQYVRLETRMIDGRATDVFFPTSSLINKVTSALIG